MQQSEKSVLANQVRKPYEKLALESYGNLRQLTANVTMVGMLDGGNGNDKTGG